MSSEMLEIIDLLNIELKFLREEGPDVHSDRPSTDRAAGHARCAFGARDHMTAR